MLMVAVFAHLKNDLPRLLAIVDEEDRQALAG
jgi:hypothetical protein